MDTCPNGFIEVPDQKSYHAATIFYWSDAFDGGPVWVERHRLTIQPGETWTEAFKRRFGIRPEPREKAFVPKGLY
jgi:hypothetical protein